MVQISLNTRRLALGGVVAVVALFLVVVVINAGRADAVGPAPAPLTEASTVTCRTDGAGYCTVSHALGVVPESVLLTPTLYRGTTPYLLGLASSSPTTLQVRAAFAPAYPMANAKIEFSYAVFAAPTPTSTTTTTTTTTTAITTTTTATLPGTGR
jgi:hypothetical protein